MMLKSTIRAAFYGADSLTARIASCVDDVNSWLSANRIQRNVGKTELLWCSTAGGMDRLLNTPLSFSGHSVNV